METIESFAYANASDMARKSLASKFTKPGKAITEIYLPRSEKQEARETCTWYFDFTVHHHIPGLQSLGLIRGSVAVKCHLPTGSVTIVVTERPEP